MNAVQEKKLETKNFFDGYWRHPDTRRDLLFRNWWAEAYDYLDSIAGPFDGKRILVVGPGFGNEAVSYARRGAWVVALDIALSSVESCAALARGQNLKDSFLPIVGDAESMPFAPGTFDAVLVLDAIVHTRPEITVAECRRVLRPGGLWAIIGAMRYPHLVVVARWFEPYRWKTLTCYTRLSDAVRWGRDASWSAHREFFILSTIVMMIRRFIPGGVDPGPVSRLAARADRWLLARFPILRAMAYLIVAGFRT